MQKNDMASIVLKKTILFTGLDKLKKKNYPQKISSLCHAAGSP